MTFFPRTSQRQSGMSILEVLIGCTIITVGLLALINAYNFYVVYALANDKNVQATYLLEEGIEAVTLLRDKSWSSYIAPLAASSTYYLYFNGTDWLLGSTPEYVDGTMLRTVVFSNVARNNDFKIVSEGTADPNTRKVTVTVTFPRSAGTTTQSMSKYIPNIFNN